MNKKHNILMAFRWVPIVIGLIVLIYVLTGCAYPEPSTPSHKDPIIQQNISTENELWTITKMESGVGATHFFITVKNDKIGCVIDITRTDEYILYDVGDTVRGTLNTVSTVSGTFTFLDTGNSYPTVGHLVLPENDTIYIP